MPEIKMQESVSEAVSHFEDYVSTYDKQPAYEEYTKSIYLNDMLYGLGITMDKSYEFADGFNQFKKDLIEFLKEITHA